MRGPLWRGWLWTPRIWWAWLTRSAGTRVGGEEQYRQRARAAPMPTRARWWHLRWWWLALLAVVALIVLILTVTQVVFPLYHLVTGWVTGRTPDSPLPAAWNPCDGDDRPHCATLTEFFKPFISAAVALAVFLALTQWRVRRWHARRARAYATDLVANAGPGVDTVVGRRELCEVLIERIRDPAVRCPTVLVGGVGAGKTAVVVELTRQLARRNIVPVPIRIRDARGTGKLDFEALAKGRLQELVDVKLFSDGDAGRLWRHLRLSNRVAVLADGLDDAFGTDHHQGEESVLRAAISQAAENRLPLIVTSRPYDPLRGMRALVIGLEPLGEGAALEYGLDGTPGLAHSSWARIVDLVNSADVTDSPLFLTIIRDLHRHDRLPPVQRPAPGGAARPVDRAEVRRQLLDAWRTALLDGALYEDVTRSRDGRTATFEVLAAFACIGVLHNSSHVDVGDAERRPGERTEQERQVLQVLRDRDVPGLEPDNPDHLTHALVEGEELAIVEMRLEDVHFLHGVVQAYLAADFLADDGLRRRLVPKLIASARNPELLIALVLLSRRLAAERDLQPGRAFGRLRLPRRDDAVGELVRWLAEGARDAENRCWRLELWAAAIEIDTSTRQPHHADLVRTVAARWHEVQEGEVPDRPMDEAKLHVVRRIGDAARLITDRRRHGGTDRPTRGADYASLFRLASREGSYRIRLAAAREIGLGGRDAVRSLGETGGLAPRTMERSPLAERAAEHAAYWRQQLRGWIVPLLCLSTGQDSEEAASERRDPAAEIREVGGDLREWLRMLEEYHPDRPGSYVPITTEMALAQGFRLAANIRRLPVGRPPADRSFLIEKAERALAHSRFWYSQLVLVQALTLMSLPSDPTAPLPRREHGANPYGLVQHWLRIAGDGVPGNGRGPAHPFLLETGRLCVLTLLSRRPERYCWIDERETTSRVGSSSGFPEVRREQSMWIPDSTGWSVLVPRAQRLLADVMLLLNLADRGDLLIDREDRLSRADRGDLPPCLTNDRRPMQPGRTVHSAESCEPGAACLDDCPFRLCPLPARGEPQPHELDQNFCARQADLTSLWYLVTARSPWQNVLRPDLRQFWREMSERRLPGWRR